MKPHPKASRTKHLPKPRRIQVRRWLCSDPSAGGSVSAYVECDEYGDGHRSRDSDLTIRDCSRSVTLNLSCADAKTRLTSLIAILERLRDGIEKADEWVADGKEIK